MTPLRLRAWWWLDRRTRWMQVISIGRFVSFRLCWLHLAIFRRRLAVERSMGLPHRMGW